LASGPANPLMEKKKYTTAPKVMASLKKNVWTAATKNRVPCHF
jgi:hypothetical protein